MKRVCIVGYGSVARKHAAALENTESAQLYAVCDIDNERIKLCREKYDVKAYTEFDEMLKDADIDTVHICTPHYLHYEMITKALDAGKKVITEKPVVMTEQEFDKLKLHKDAETVAIVFQNRLNACVKKLKEITDSKQYGEIICCRGILTWNRNRNYYNSGAWRGKWATEGGGVLINQAIHTLDLMGYLCGGFKSLKANMANYSLSDLIEVEDTFSAMLKFRNDARGIFFATNAYGANSRVDIEIMFENATAHYTDNRLFINDELVCSDVAGSGNKSYWGVGHADLIKNYYENNSFFNIYDAENSMRTVYAMYDSAKQHGKEIVL